MSTKIPRVAFARAVVLAFGLPLLVAPHMPAAAAVQHVGTKARAERPSVQRVTSDHLRRAITAFLESSLEGRVEEVEVEVLEPAEPVSVAGGQLRWDVSVSGPTDHAGRRRFHLTPLVDGRAQEVIDVVADVTFYAEVVVATHVLKPDDLIEPEDLALSRVKVPGVAHQLITQLSDAVGKSPGRVLPSQQPIRAAALARPFAVRKGDRVTIEARRGGLAIQAVGTTKSAAQQGSFVTVTNADSGKDIRAKVVGPGLVRVDF